MSPIRIPSGEKHQGDDSIQLALAGQYSPEKYHVKGTDGAEIRLRKQQINCLYAECAGLEAQVNSGQLTVDHLLDARRRLCDAKLEFHDEPQERRVVLAEQLKNAKALESSFAERMEAGLIRPAAAYRATSFRIDAELALLKLDKEIKRKAVR